MRSIRAVLASLALCACGQPAARTPASPHASHPTTAAAAAPVKGDVIDQGVFLIQLAAADAGEEHFAITQRSDGYTFDSTFEIATAQLHVSSKNQIVTDRAFRPEHASLTGVTNGVAFTEILTPGPPMTLDVDEGGQKHSLTAPRAVDALLADNSIVHMTIFCRRDDKPATILVFPGIETLVGPSTPAGDRGLVHRQVQASGQGIVDLYCDGPRLIAAEAPAVQMTAIRRGDEARYAAAKPRLREKPALPDGLVELERNVSIKPGKGDKDTAAATLACSLVLPSAMRDVTKRPAKGALPAVLLLNDYGPEDRDGDTVGAGGVKLSFDKTVAIALGQAGIASLRCDDRGVGGSSGDFSQITLPILTSDAEAAAAALRAEPAIDPKRVGVLGHGEGGEIAPIAAVDLPWLRAIALCGTAGRPFDEVVMDQDDRAMQRQGATDDQRKAAHDSAVAVRAAIKSGAPLPPNTPNAQQIESSRPWLQSELAHDPYVAAGKVKKTPVMIAQADQDQTATAHDAELLRAALLGAGNPGVEYHLYAGLHHWFAPTITGNVDELSDPKAMIERRFLDDVTAFFRAHL